MTHEVAIEVQARILREAGGSIHIDQIVFVLKEMFPKGLATDNVKEFVDKYPELCRPSKYSCSEPNMKESVVGTKQETLKPFLEILYLGTGSDGMKTGLKIEFDNMAEAALYFEAVKPLRVGSDIATFFVDLREPDHTIKDSIGIDDEGFVAITGKKPESAEYYKNIDSQHWSFCIAVAGQYIKEPKNTGSSHHIAAAESIPGEQRMVVQEPLTREQADLVAKKLKLKNLQ